MDDAQLGGSVEAEVWDLLDADETVSEETAYLVAAALHGDDDLAEQLGGQAPVPERPGTTTTDTPAPLRAFLRSITVSGFRGIGPRATLELNPYYGITVISGRNGSGKSSFAEALEYARYRFNASPDTGIPHTLFPFFRSCTTESQCASCGSGDAVAGVGQITPGSANSVAPMSMPMKAPKSMP